MMNADQRQAAVDPQTKQINLAVSMPVGCYHQYPASLFSITQPES